MPYIMVVDDDEDFADAEATVLRADGHEVSVELDIASAEKSLERRAPDLIILDVMFPEDNSAGFAFARRLRTGAEQLKSIPIIMLTAINQEFPLGFGRDDIDADWMPVTEFLEKPVDLDVLSRRVAALLAASQGQ